MGDVTVTTRAASVGLAFALVASIAGCSGYGNPRFGGAEAEPQPGYEEFVDERQYVPDQPSQQEIDQAIQESEQQVREELGLGSWSCALSVTFNDDWHDDVFCSNGTESHRPHLREWDEFVDEAEILQSAAEYEAALNAGE